MCRGGPGGGKPSSPGAACSTVAMALRGSSFPRPPRKARDTHWSLLFLRKRRPRLACRVNRVVRGCFVVKVRRFLVKFSGRVSRALRGGRGKEEPLSAIAMVLQAAPGDDDLPPPGPPRHTSAAQCLTARTREASPCAGYPAHGSACQPRIHASVVRVHGIQACLLYTSPSPRD